MKANIAAVGLGHPFEVGFDQAESLLNTTVDTLTAQGINCTNVNVVMHDLDTVKQAAEALKQINENGYAAPYASCGKKIVKVGANFSTAKRTLDRWEVQE